MKKRSLLRMAFIVGTWMTGYPLFAWDEPTQVDGVYQIGTASELEWFAEYINSASAVDASMLTAKAVLTANIDMTGVSHTPIGASTTYKFSGEFDGQHHVISNMIINLPNQENVGFFGLVRGNAIIKNLIIDSSCSVTGKNRVAGLIGCVQTKSNTLTILNCVNMATVHATTGVASGIIGAGQSKYPVFKIHNCVNTGDITTDAENNYTVAFDGWNKYDESGTAVNSQVWCCYNKGTLNKLDGGNNIFRGSHRSVLNTYDLVYTASNMQSQTNIPSGGFKTVDPLHSGELCYYLNHGIEMMNRKEVSLGDEFTQDLSDPNSIPMPNASGMKVYQVADLNCDGTPKGSVVYSNTEGGSRDPHQFDPATGYCTVCGAINEEYVVKSEDGFYHLSTPAQVEWFSQMVRLGHHGGMDVKLDADIDFGGVPNAHLPIGTSGHKYWGHFDGQGHRIIGMVLDNNLVQDNPGYDGKGFFGSVRGGGTDDVWNVTKNTPIIENLIIDSSCSIKHNQNFAAGVVAHINATNSGVTIIIRNCGNEADVTTTGKNAAGILGCVEGTNVGLKLYNLWNKGNITGNGGESAAICAWTGQRNVNDEVDVQGCWNIGEVTGVDGNGYNLIRRNTNIVPRNIVDLCTSNGGNQGKVTVNTTNPIESGELCYFLNGDQSNIVYTQTLGVDAMPVYGTTSMQVYQAGTINCLGKAVGELDFNNVGGITTYLDHNYNANGICDVCSDFLEPMKDGDYYLLANAGNVEWLSAKVATSGGAAFYAKLTNDIDFQNIENLHNPIGPAVGCKFKGVFDGQGHSIKNMIINRPSDNNIGFFGFLQGNATTEVKNLIIDSSCTIHANNRVGGLTGSYQNPDGTITIENVVNEATVIAEHQDAGGIIGGHEGGDPTIIIRNVMNKGTITAKNEHPFAGALCCYMGVGAGSLIENFVNLGTINGHEGGNIGRHNISNVNNLIDLSATTNKNQGVRDDLTTEDIANGKLAYTVGWGQLIGTDVIPSPLGSEQVFYVGSAGFTTMYDADYDWVLSGDAQAYIGTLNGNYLHLSEIDDVPAGTAVIIGGTYYNKVSTTATADATGNNLLGSDGTVTGGSGIYALANKSKGIGFYPVSNSVTIPAGKTYLQVAGNAVREFYPFGGEMTAINSLTPTLSKGEGAVYDLSGRLINSKFIIHNSKLRTGIYIQNGKKVIF
ncbi:MAG: hypothetical protein J5524_10150 [Bacteroidaceae bacterium]|nr:hypothetical protein [Bacteroidaceae bacterium]